jgi:hypothetical protein
LLGDMRAFMPRLPALVKEAQERGDLYLQTVLTTAVAHTAALVDDDPDRSRREVAEALAAWNVPDAIHAQHFQAVMSDATTDVYAGEPLRAYEGVASRWRAFQRSLIMHMQTLRCVAHFNRGRAALAAARHGRPELLRVAAADARALQREKIGYCVAVGTIVEGGVRMLRGDHDGAVRAYRQAASLCDEVEMRLHAEGVRWELGRILGGDEGAALVAAAEEALRAQGVRAPARMVTTFTGGITT